MLSIMRNDNRRGRSRTRRGEVDGNSNNIRSETQTNHYEHDKGNMKKLKEIRRDILTPSDNHKFIRDRQDMMSSSNRHNGYNVDLMPVPTTVHDYDSGGSDDEWLQERVRASRYAVVDESIDNSPYAVIAPNRAKSLIVMSDEEEEDEDDIIIDYRISEDDKNYNFGTADYNNNGPYADENINSFSNANKTLKKNLNNNNVLEKNNARKNTNLNKSSPIINQVPLKSQHQRPQPIEHLWSSSTDSVNVSNRLQAKAYKGSLLGSIDNQFNNYSNSSQNKLSVTLGGVGGGKNKLSNKKSEDYKLQYGEEIEPIYDSPITKKEKKKVNSGRKYAADAGPPLVPGTRDSMSRTNHTSASNSGSIYELKKKPTEEVSTIDLDASVASSLTDPLDTMLFHATSMSETKKYLKADQKIRALKDRYENGGKNSLNKNKTTALLSPISDEGSHPSGGGAVEISSKASSSRKEGSLVSNTQHSNGSRGNARSKPENSNNDRTLQQKEAPKLMSNSNMSKADSTDNSRRSSSQHRRRSATPSRKMDERSAKSQRSGSQSSSHRKSKVRSESKSERALSTSEKHRHRSTSRNSARKTGDISSSPPHSTTHHNIHTSNSTRKKKSKRSKSREHEAYELVHHSEDDLTAAESSISLVYVPKSRDGSISRASKSSHSRKSKSSRSRRSRSSHSRPRRNKSSHSRRSKSSHSRRSKSSHSRRSKSSLSRRSKSSLSRRSKSSLSRRSKSSVSRRSRSSHSKRSKGSESKPINSNRIKKKSDIDSRRRSSSRSRASNRSVDRKNRSSSPRPRSNSHHSRHSTSRRKHSDHSRRSTRSRSGHSRRSGRRLSAHSHQSERSRSRHRSNDSRGSMKSKRLKKHNTSPTKAKKTKHRVSTPHNKPVKEESQTFVVDISKKKKPISKVSKKTKKTASPKKEMRTKKKKSFKGSKYITDFDVKDEEVERARYECTREMIDLLEKVQLDGTTETLKKKKITAGKKLGDTEREKRVKKTMVNSNLNETTRVMTKSSLSPRINPYNLSKNERQTGIPKLNESPIRTRKDIFRNFSNFFKLRKKNEIVIMSASSSKELDRFNQQKDDHSYEDEVECDDEVDEDCEDDEDNDEEDDDGDEDVMHEVDDEDEEDEEDDEEDDDNIDNDNNYDENKKVDKRNRSKHRHDVIEKDTKTVHGREDIVHQNDGHPENDVDDMKIQVDDTNEDTDVDDHEDPKQYVGHLSPLSDRSQPSSIEKNVVNKKLGQEHTMNSRHKTVSESQKKSTKTKGFTEETHNVKESSSKSGRLIKKEFKSHKLPVGKKNEAETSDRSLLSTSVSDDNGLSTNTSKDRYSPCNDKKSMKKRASEVMGSKKAESKLMSEGADSRTSPKGTADCSQKDKDNHDHLGWNLTTSVKKMNFVKKGGAEKKKLMSGKAVEGGVTTTTIKPEQNECLTTNIEGGKNNKNLNIMSSHHQPPKPKFAFRKKPKDKIATNSDQHNSPKVKKTKPIKNGIDQTLHKTEAVKDTKQLEDESNIRGKQIHNNDVLPTPNTPVLSDAVESTDVKQQLQQQQQQQQQQNVTKYNPQKMAQSIPAEIDEYSIGEPYNEPGCVQCLRFYSCDPAANVLNVAIKVTDVCSEVKENDSFNVNDDYKLSGHRSRDAVLASRTLDENSLLGEGARQVGIASGSISSFGRRYNHTETSSPHGVMPTVEVVLEDEPSRSFSSSLYRFIDKTNSETKRDLKLNTNDDDDDDEYLEEAPPLALKHVPSFVVDVSRKKLQLDEDSEGRRTREAIQRGIASADERSVVSITSINVPAKVVRGSSHQNSISSDDDEEENEIDNDDEEYEQDDEPEDQQEDDQEDDHDDDDRSEGDESGDDEASESSGIVEDDELFLDQSLQFKRPKKKTLPTDKTRIGGAFNNGTNNKNRVQRIFSRFRHKGHDRAKSKMDL